MNQKVYAVRDVKADAFGQLITCPARGLAVRVFRDVAADPRGDIARYPEDFQLYELGEYDQTSGQIKPHALPVFVMSAVEARAEAKPAPEPEVKPAEEVKA